MQSNTPAPLTVTSVLKHITEFTLFRQSQQKLNIINFVKVEFIAELLYWIALDCTDVPNKVTTEHQLPNSFFFLLYLPQSFESNACQLLQPEHSWAHTHTHTHTHSASAILPMPVFASSNIHTPCFHFSLPLLFLVFPPSSHHKLTAPSYTLVKKHPPSQQCTVTRDETFSPQETSCSETLWLKCVFSWDMERRAGGGFWGDGGVVLELNGDHVGVSSRPVNQKSADV